jgi:hypothetical protein
MPTVECIFLSGRFFKPAFLSRPAKVEFGNF